MLIGNSIGLRAIEQNDLAQLLLWRNQPEFRRFFREYRELSSDNQAIWYDKVVLNDRNTMMFAIIDKESKRLLGACGLCYINWVDRSADFSIYIGADSIYIDGLFAIDAAKTMVKFAYEELSLHRLWSEIYDFDEAKKAMFATLGFTLDGRHRQTHWSEGSWHDSLFYSLLSSDSIPKN
ncbi:N-acetyltransferase [Paenibacillus psychroresistens]|uniref:N-acetyltransferase n=1 Tax=Paenibacillus psychroresistens TaxID=1778678 RepID=A0A6B8RB48_9BACL|nr:GNAT family protein [Paenibacillus psychroresistens]QGQ93530.1 N-acetyltransferase [Paenibacillus psychroresistens]